MNDADKLIVRVIATDDVDADDIDGRVFQIRDDLIELGLDGVQPMPDPNPPAGAKGLGTILGTLTGVFFSWDMLSTALGALAGSWVTRNRTLHVTIGSDSLVLTNSSAAERKQIIEAFMARHREL